MGIDHFHINIGNAAFRLQIVTAAGGVMKVNDTFRINNNGRTQQ
jgi:hypothetical protein